MSDPPIGFVGLGVMGLPMALNLSRAGYSLTVFDIDSAAVERAVGTITGVKVARSPAEVAQASAIVVTMLPSGKEVRQVALGEEGLIHGFGEGALLLDTSSSQPWLTIETAEALARSGVAMVDAPVSGALIGAQTGELVFMAGGEPAALERVAPLFKVMGKQVFHLGGVGAGHTMKCLNNLVTAMTFMATTEGLAIGKKLGLDPEVMTDVLNVSTGGSWISQTQIRQRITSRKFDDAFKLELMVKDIGIAMSLAGEQAIPVPLCGVGHQMWRAAAQYAEEGASISDMVRWVEHMTGITITAGSSAQTPGRP
ncbi:MAG: NAD(P)-dependent oxidoreductase [Actinomycetia bacterium]|nr:NAD(P)-dependent oxidoreductase [Actinomycetes bacterium]